MYRDGVGEGHLRFVCETELEEIQVSHTNNRLEMVLDEFFFSKYNFMASK